MPISYDPAHKYNLRTRYTDRISPISFIDEIWVDITSIMVENIKPGYMISNYGRVYNSIGNNMLLPIINSVTGYAWYRFVCSDSIVRGSSAHRLVMIGFEYIDNYKDMQVNHIDGVKYCNHSSNLEWVDGKGNMRHAYDNNLCPQGEDHPNSYFTADQVHLICKGLEQGISYVDICNNLLGIEYTRKISGVITSIRNGRNWKSISKLYNIVVEGRSVNSDRVFSDEQIHDICKCLELGMKPRQILVSIGYNLSEYTKNELDNLAEYIGRIRRRTHFSHISNNYTF